ncbi:MAG: GGGtGRT protein, partial [Clostridia bacterium]
MEIKFESKERRIDKINAVCAEYGINGLEEAKAICDQKGIDVEHIVKGI